MEDYVNKQILDADEVILLEYDVSRLDYKGTLHLTLTSNRIFFDKITIKGVLTKQQVVENIDTIMLDHIKVYDGKVQAKNTGEKVQIQTIEENVVVVFETKKDASKFVSKIVDAATGTTAVKRSVNKVKEAIKTVDDVLGEGTTAAIIKTGAEVAMSFIPLSKVKNGTSKKIAKAATAVTAAIAGKKE